MTRTMLAALEFVQDMGTSSLSGLIMVPGQEANGDKGSLFDLLHRHGILSVLIRIALMRRF